MISFILCAATALPPPPVYAQAMGDGARGKRLRHFVPGMTVAKTLPLEPCGGTSCTYSTQLLMGADESMFARWDSASGVTVHDATTLEALYTVPGTADHSCFHIDTRSSTLTGVGVVLWVLQPGGPGQLLATNFTLSRTTATKIGSTAVAVDEWKTKSGETRYAAECFAQWPQHEKGLGGWPPLFATQEQGKLYLRFAFTPSHAGAAPRELTPPAGCVLNASVGEPLLLKSDGVVALYMSCANQLPTQLVAYKHVSQEGPPLAPLWQAEVGFLDRTFSDYRFVGAGGAVLYQNADAKVVGALKASDGSSMWTRSTDGNADGVLAANDETALLFTARNATVTAVHPAEGHLQWYCPVLEACGVRDPTARVYQMAAMVEDFKTWSNTHGMLGLAWLSTGQNCLLHVNGSGTILGVQPTALNTSILPPNAADILVTSDAVIAYLGSPGRFVRLEGKAAAAAAAAAA
jgi:hypothetical protein